MDIFGYEIPYGDDIKNILGYGTQIYDSFQKGNAADSYYDSLRQQQMDDYNRQKEQYDAQVAYLTGPYAEYQQAAAANSAANRNAAASASAATRRNQLAALKKGNRVERKGYKQAIKQYKPFADAAYELLPQMTGAYSSGINALQAMAGDYLSPEGRATAPKSVAAHNTHVPIPEYLRQK